ncbi:hypothetical protein ADK94_26810 [Streptomyces sp. XY593]|uniref:hypothetical protein n=1 Tax=Streptomyces sp. XY593 TaxID=1519483 RepID=UPI0006AF82D7|nr:hypothetical protein [Streptomyces sp. XY593]KOU81328.1 hypothetical protein ADK94_26810 [Streptomyces sp. XY593]
MRAPLTLASLGAPLTALRKLADEYGHLPAPSVSVSTLYPDTLVLTFYDDLAGFETWREALAIPSRNVSHDVQSRGRTRVLEAKTGHADGVVKLVGYASIPTVEEARSRVGVGS